jgi:hypothetical protein
MSIQLDGVSKKSFISKTQPKPSRKNRNKLNDEVTETEEQESSDSPAEEMTMKDDKF